MLSFYYIMIIIIVIAIIIVNIMNVCVRLACRRETKHATPARFVRQGMKERSLMFLCTEQRHL